MDNEKFTGIWVPKDVLSNKDLNPMEKIFFSHIGSLAVGKHGCFAENPHLAELLGVSLRYIQSLLSKFKRLDLITFDHRDDKRYIELVDEQLFAKQTNNCSPAKDSSQAKRTTVRKDTNNSSPPNEQPFAENGVSSYRKNSIIQSYNTGIDKGTDTIVSGELSKTPIEKADIKKPPPKKPNPETQVLNDQFADLVSKWNELTGQEQVIDLSIRNMFYGKVKKHGFESVYQAMENYALSEWHQEKQAWKFIQIFTGKDFIGKYVNKRPEQPKQLNKYDAATHDFLKYADKRKSKNEL